MSLRLTLVASFICLVSAETLLYAQQTAPDRRAPSVDSQVLSETQPTQIGQSGYTVTIPEIKLQSIIGEKSKKQTTPKETDHRQTELDHNVSSGGAIESEDERKPTRLPFDPADLGQTDSLPSPEDGPSSTDGAKASPEESLTKVSPEKAAPEPSAIPPTDEQLNPVYHPPIAPEETLDQSFAPKKEIFRKVSTVKLPSIVVLESKGAKLSRLEIATSGAKEPLTPEDWVALDSRREPLLVELPDAENEQSPESPYGTTRKAESQPSGPDLSDQRSQSGRTIVSESTDVPPGFPQAERPTVEAREHEGLLPEESVTSHPKEAIPSPLDENALDSREARDYLRDTAPILEELSLLMTRAPGLNIEDYDPSDTNSALVPTDIRLKMTSIKRELQVLDSKTFAIIPPPRYLAFHGLVRESIAHTYQACDAIINYFEENKVENFQKAKEHLVKAGELIRKTIRPGNSS